MIIKPRVRGFLCATTHPHGCRAHVREQIDYVKGNGPVNNGPKRVLVIGASTGYGLASRIVSAFGAGAATLGIFFERPSSENKLGSPGWYNSAAFQEFAEAEGLYAKSINGDAFSDEIKQQAMELIRQEMGQVDLVIYSLAAPKRVHPRTGEVHRSTLKPTGKPTTQKGIDTDKGTLQTVHLEPATEQEIEDTVAVMGGEDWQMWIEALDEAGLLADGAKTTAYTYLGGEITWDIYWNGTIGAAKKDLDRRAAQIHERLAAKGGEGRVSVLKALVTQASAAIPAMPIYLALLFKVMKERGTHEGCIEQIDRLFRESLCSAEPVLDDEGRIRVDLWELDPEVQSEVARRWEQLTDDNIDELTDFAGYQRDFLKLFGFGLDGIDYEADVDPHVTIPNLAYDSGGR
ncbi:trans-2-enoyl-CoA reductase [Halorhodospira abdelmalekii]|uniref:enoyl-ACP reductase FabV n=1 Tax=Halorhodospira abdelmalekii TaxID=421629 RepID=UPI001903FB7F|nr:enoyl-ACP reductase FabV [Halorhodospira abdelmalekii]MBK1735425.1 trans-2-enoyl-CoA reductase [Halorhodospira abdelmalekii]